MDARYNFGTMTHKGVEKRFVRTKSTDPDLLPIGSFVTVEESYPDMKVTRSFHVDDLYERREQNGEFYTWYFISEYSEYIDRTPACNAALEQMAANMDYMCMMADITLPNEDEEM